MPSQATNLTQHEVAEVLRDLIKMGLVKSGIRDGHEVFWLAGKGSRLGDAESVTWLTDKAKAAITL